MKKFLMLSFVALAAFHLSASAAMYKWEDENGVTHYSDSPATIPKNTKSQKFKVASPKKPQPEEVADDKKTLEELIIQKLMERQKKAKPEPPPEPPQVGTLIPYRERRGIMLVDVKVNGSVEEFIFDTGASGTVVTSGLQKKYKIRALGGRKVILQTVAGKVKAHRIRIDKMEIGEYTVTSVDAVVRDFTNPNSKTVGLLGQNVLGHFAITISRKDRTIRLVRER